MMKARVTLVIAALCAAGVWVSATHVHARAGDPSGDVEAENLARYDPESGDTIRMASNDPSGAVQLASMDPRRGAVTNLPIPRYVSLKAAEGNVRRGPSLSHRIDWVFRHRDMPLRVTAEFGHWRRVEDKDGAGGWVHYALISGVRTVVFTDPKSALLAQPEDNSTVLATAEVGAIARLQECSADWCRVSADGEKGWVRKSEIWGVDKDETFQ